MIDTAKQNLFWSKVAVGSADQCWPWLAAKRGAGGYGCFKFNGKMRGAHRVAYTILNGEIPKGLVVRHKCDNPPCCNPKHLLVGTYRQNSNDCTERGRNIFRIGEGHPMALLTSEDVMRIRNYAASGNSQRKIVRDLGFSTGAVLSAIYGWKHLPMPEGARKQYSKDKLLEINALLMKGFAQRKVASMAGVSQATVCRAARLGAIK